MNKYSIDKIRNVCIMAHGGAGKTSFVEAMLFNTGVSDRLGKIIDGTTFMDYDPEEIKRKFSINTAVAYLEWKKSKINIIDTPGYFDFVGEVTQGIRAADAAIILASGRTGVSVGTEHSWDYAAERSLPVMFFINKMEHENANFANTIADLKKHFGISVVPFQLPIKEEEKLVGFVDVITLKAYKYNGAALSEISVPDSMAEEVADFYNALVEVVAESNETLMEKYFAGQEFSVDELIGAVKLGVKARDIFPVFLGSVSLNAGVIPIMDAIAEYFPSPKDVGEITGVKPGTDEVVTLIPEDSAPLSALVFKTIADPFVGKLSLFRVYSGVMKPDSTVLNSTTGLPEKIGRLYMVRGKKQTETDCISAGDIGAVTKLVGTATGDTLCSPSKPVVLESISFPTPALSLAIVPKEKGDEEKIGSCLHRLEEEDPTFKVSNNTETKQTLISGVGEQHLDVIVSKLKTKFGVSVYLIEPKVPYRETIRKKVKVEGKHKKQSGGHGQFGHVWIEFEPGETEELTFCEKVFGGSVPKNYFPAVEKGLQDSVVKGVLAGYPVVYLKATLVDGSYHPVDSSEMAFKIAASAAYKEGLKQASPVLLEPIGKLCVTVPETYMGDIIGDINKRRGRILGMNAKGNGVGVVEAEVPLSELFKYATDLRSMTQARGAFSLEFIRYEEAPANIAQIIIDGVKAKQEE